MTFSEQLKEVETLKTGARSKEKGPHNRDNTHPMVYVVFASLLLDLLAFTMILPLLPSLLDLYDSRDSSGLYPYLLSQVKFFQHLVGAPDRFNSVLFGGILGSMFSFLQFVTSPLVGGLSDAYGRKPAMLLCLTSRRGNIGISFNLLPGLLLRVFFLLTSFSVD
ncbi:hypothetical protein J437_LFUL018425 [Ladona fulva]|uniref:Major facilitator superfamily (MFS) profile domain-containing protein n=1 Tax=Ladona fulva TaxID=123851 RepID=A0A8K0KQB1_LADFU|nr:hypothetical protein J437_LFUL018425 [Ladona fulva]